MLSPIFRFKDLPHQDTIHSEMRIISIIFPGLGINVDFDSKVYMLCAPALLTPEQPILFLLIEDVNLLWIAAPAGKISGNTPSPSGGR
jgi:hypothetical protein